MKAGHSHTAEPGEGDAAAYGTPHFPEVRGHHLPMAQPTPEARRPQALPGPAHPAADAAKSPIPRKFFFTHLYQEQLKTAPNGPKLSSPTWFCCIPALVHVHYPGRRCNITQLSRDSAKASGTYERTWEMSHSPPHLLHNPSHTALPKPSPAFVNVKAVLLQTAERSTHVIYEKHHIREVNTQEWV